MHESGYRTSSDAPFAPLGGSLLGCHQRGVGQKPKDKTVKTHAIPHDLRRNPTWTSQGTAPRLTLPSLPWRLPPRLSPTRLWLRKNKICENPCHAPRLEKKPHMHESGYRTSSGSPSLPCRLPPRLSPTRLWLDKQKHVKTPFTTLEGSLLAFHHRGSGSKKKQL
jgi:hypothetical protein